MTRPQTEPQPRPENRMLRIVHVSDLHFGTEQPEMTALLHADIDELKPDLVVVSGDFTQTAADVEFRAARSFLDNLGFPNLTVPGNHDVPRYNIFERFISPYKKYRRHVARDMQQVFRKNGVCVAGINTARSMMPHWNWANGSIARWQMKWLNEQFEAEPCLYRICVMHHPVWEVAQARIHTIVFGGTRAMEFMKEMRVNLVLSGHVHHAAVESMPIDDKNKMVFLSASTALSRRLRGQKNGFNIVDLYEDRMMIEMRGFLEGRFAQLEIHEHMIH